MSPVAPVDAATVILTRVTTPGEWQCFMVRRHVRSEFAADVYVFPGGKVDAGDRERDVPLHASADTGDTLLPFRLAAIRELFEEVGVLLACREGSTLIRLEGDDQSKFGEYRRRVHAGDVPFVEVVRREGLRLAVDRLTPISRWITPEALPRRFDTYFFLASIPEGQTALHDAVETTAGIWISPRDALERSANGNFPLVFATEKHLQRLSRSGSPEAVVAGTTPEDLEPVIPKIVHRNGQTQFLLPGDIGYSSEHPLLAP